MNFLLDTNTVIYLINDRLATALPAGRYGVSIITEIELLSFPDLQVDEERRIRAFLLSLTAWPSASRFATRRSRCAACID